MKKIVPGGIAGLLAAAVLAAPAPAAPANVTVRVEGESQTLLTRTAVATTTDPVLGDGTNSCPGTSAGGALYRAVGGDLGGTWLPGLGFQVKTIKGETQDAPSGSDPARYWSFWVNYRYQDAGLCGTELQQGDDVIILVDCYSITIPCAPAQPLKLGNVPPTVTPGQTITVKVDEYANADPAVFPSVTTSKPSQGATVSAGGQTAITGADGTAKLTLSTPGPASITVTKPDRVRTAGLTCVTTGHDGNCGSQLPPGAVLGTTHPDDKTAPKATLAGLRNGKVFKHGKGPRKLTGSVTPDPSGLSAVRLSIVRKVGKRCWAYDGRRERFARHRCGGWKYFRIGDRNHWSYLLPRRLPQGRYTIKVAATDKSANRSESQVVIRVR